MAIRRIYETPDAVLRQISKPVETFDKELKTLVADMFETMYEAPGIGLAAVQVGVPIRLLVIDLQEPEDEEDPESKPVRDPRVFVNPEILYSDGEAECEDERQGLDEYEVVRELVAPRLRAGRSLADGRHDTERREGQAGHEEEPGDDPHVLTGAGLRLALSRTALERLERAQLVPRLFRRRGGVEAQPPRLGLDDPLTDPDVDRAALDTRGPTLAPEAQVALRERVRHGVVCDA